MAGANQYDRLNDPELGSGKYDAKKEPAKQLPICYCEYSFLGIPCPIHDLTEEQAEEWKALDILVKYVPPEPETMSRWEFPWQDDLGESPTDTRSQFSGF